MTSTNSQERSYGPFQRYLCKDCDRMFNDKTGTIFAHSKVALRKWLFSIHAFLRFNTSVRQLQREIHVRRTDIAKSVLCWMSREDKLGCIGHNQEFV
jgi:transposase-like protein